MPVPNPTTALPATRLEWRTTPAGRPVAVLTLDLPGKSVNLLSSEVMAELGARLDEVDGAGDAAGLVIASAKAGVFVAGADVNEFAAKLTLPTEEVVEACRRGQRLFARLSQGDRVSVAVVEGLCLGGSSGINIAGAIRLARELGPGHTIVTILCDYGTRYQSKLYDPAFLRSKELPVPSWLARKPAAIPQVFEEVPA